MIHQPLKFCANIETKRSKFIHIKYSQSYRKNIILKNNFLFTGSSSDDILSTQYR